MRIVSCPEGYAVKIDDIDYPLCWVSKEEMDKMQDGETSCGIISDANVEATIMKDIPMYYSNDGRLWPNPVEECCGHTVGDAAIFRVEK